MNRKELKKVKKLFRLKDEDGREKFEFIGNPNINGIAMVRNGNEHWHIHFNIGKDCYVERYKHATNADDRNIADVTNFDDCRFKIYANIGKRVE